VICIWNSRHSVHEYLIDRVRADEIPGAGAVDEHRHLLGAAHQILDHDAARTRRNSRGAEYPTCVADQGHGEIVEMVMTE